jgi:hypothetical protein
MKGINGNADWLRERADGIRRKDRPTTESEWLAFAKGLDMIADDWEKTHAMILNAIADEKQSN